MRKIPRLTVAIGEAGRLGMTNAGSISGNKILRVEKVRNA
jgi:hypothetical protein